MKHFIPIAHGKFPWKASDMDQVQVEILDWGEKMIRFSWKKSATHLVLPKVTLLLLLKEDAND